MTKWNIALSLSTETYFLAANKISEPVSCIMVMKLGRGFGKFAI